jgi:hypothetical protein
MKSLYLVLTLLVIWGCNPQESSVEIKTGGIFKPITFGIDNQDLSGKDLDLGEWVTSDGAKPLTVTVRNNTLFPYTEIDLSFSPLNNEFTAMRFKPMESGESTFPGDGGTCERTLAPGLTCTILVELVPPIDGEYKEQLHLSFKNYVDFESHIGSIYILSGIPAELAIQNMSSRIRFGDIVGSDALVERTIPRTFTQSFTIKNVGGLSARSIIINNINICKDVNDNNCDDYKDAYSIESHNCQNGDRIKKDQTCDFTLTYTPKNNPEIIAERYERIRYEGGLTVEYIKNPSGARATLGVNYDSLSSKIEGRLLSSAILDLSSNGVGTVQGNRISKDIRAINVGYRSLRINKIRVTKPLLSDSTDESWVMCERQSGTTILHCYDEGDATKAAKPLRNFPFSINDLDGCVGDKNNGPLIPINNGCNFRVTFQPSSATQFVDPTTPTNFEQTTYDKIGKDIKFFVIYDSQWKDGENHCDNQVACDPLPEVGFRKTNFHFKVKAKRRSAARLELFSIKYNNIALKNIPDISGEINSSPASSLDYLRTYDFERLALLANSQKGKATAFKKIQIVFKNVGQESAILDKITFPLNDTTEITIPHDTQVLPLLNDSNDCINTLNHCYYRNAKVVSDCTELSSEQLCTIEISFAPFVFTNLLFDKNQAMYNYPFPAGLTTEKFKTFKVFYRNGANFTDDVNASTPDFPLLKSEVRLRATLTEKGQLEEIADDPDNFKALGQGITRGSKVTYKMRLTNVGSGRVSRVNLLLGGTGYAFSASPDCSAVIKDCRCYKDSTENCLINPTSDSLPSDGECFLPLSWKLGSTNPVAEVTETDRISAGTISSQEKANDVNRVNYSSYGTTSTYALTSNLSYYDCFRHTQAEIDSGKAGANYNLTFGYPISQPQFRTSVGPLYQPVRLIPLIPNSAPSGMIIPWHTTTLGRKQMTNGALGLTWAERIFYDLLNSSSVNYDWLTPLIDQTQNSSLIIAARDSYKYGRELLNNGSFSFLNNVETNTITYYYFLGSFPRYTIGSGTTSYKVPLNITNINPGTGVIKSIQVSNVAGTGSISLREIINNVEQATILSTNSNYNLPIASLGAIGLSAQINPSLCTAGKCLYATNVLLTYDTGKRDQDRVGTDWVKTCDPSTDEECERKIRIVVFGEVESTTTPPVRFDSSLVGVTLSGNSMYEDCMNPMIEFTQGTWNQVNGGTALPLTSLRYNLPLPTNPAPAYAKRIIKITNTSAVNLNLKRTFLRQNTNIPVKYLANSSDILQNSLNTNRNANCTVIVNNPCNDNKTLVPNDSCYTTVRYLPTISNFVNLHLSYLFTSTSSQNPHHIYNVPLSFQPILPATIRPVNASTNAPLSAVGVKTRLKADGTIGAIENTINGTFKIVIPAQTFSQTSPTQVYTHYQKVLNTTTTKASLLYQWRHYNNNLNGDPNPLSFATDPIDNRSYVQIGQNSLGFMKIFASRQCLYGGDANPTSESGFNNSEQQCYLKVTIDNKHNNMLNTSVISKSETIDPYVYRVQYYSASRSTVNSFVFYVEYNNKPAPLLATNTSWGTITSVGLNTTINFPAHSASTPDIGNIVGYRVIRTRLIASLSDFFNLTNTDITRTDVYNTASPQVLFTAPSTETGRIYHYKVLAIRQHPNFTKGDVFFGFASNKKDHFITDITNFNFVKVFVPPPGNIYYHAQKLMIDTTRHSTMEEYLTSLSRCTVKTISIKNGNSTPSVAKSLINSTAWSVLPSADQTGDPLWIFSTSPIPFTSVCPAMESFEYLDTTKKCFRGSLEVTSGREMRGNLFEYDLISPAVVEDTLSYGYSRCMTNLSTFL